MPGVALVTGAHGFAGRHLVACLREGGHEVVAPSSRELDLRDAARTRDLVARTKPDRVFHLGALASVGRSWEDPARPLLENQQMTVHLLEAVRHEAPRARTLLAGSGEVYGRPDRLPVTEDAPLAPQSPYGLSKAASDMLGRLYADAWGLHVVRTRAFNHAGPGQSDTYVVGSLARQAAEAAAAGSGELVLRTGDPDAARDFTDVRDVVRAYALAVDLDSGAYNVASGAAHTVRQLVGIVARQSGLPVRHEVDPARVRAHDVREVRGSAERLRAASGWRPEIPLEQTIADAIAAWGDSLG